MFNLRTVKVYNPPTSAPNEYNINVLGQPTFKTTILADIQPISQDKAVKDFGISKKVKYRLYADIVGLIELNELVEINDHLFEVVGLIQWDDYCDFVVGDL